MTRRPSFLRDGILPGRLLWAIALIFALAAPAMAARELPAVPAQSAIALLPYLDWLPDGDGKLTVEDVAKPERQAAFRPLNPRALSMESGIAWLRLTLAPRPAEARPAALLLDLGNQAPGTPVFYSSRVNVLTGAMEWQKSLPNQRSVFLMPESRGEPQSIYIRLEGLPGLWFAPELRTPHNAATDLSRLAHPALLAALAAVMLLCLLRGLTERGEWRIWTSAYVGSALVSAAWGLPATARGYVDMSNIVGVLTPGVALMLLPHVGRHLMRTRSARALDIQYVLLSLPGAALALLPLLPGYSWMTRYLELWPAGTLLLAPTTLAAWLNGLPGTRRFLLGCLLPPAGVAAAWLGIGSTAVSPSLLGVTPLLGVTLSALIIAGTGTPREHLDAKLKTTSAPAQDFTGDADVRVIPREVHDAPELRPNKIRDTDSGIAALEEKLRPPLDSLLRDAAALEQCSLPPAARQLCRSVLETIRGLTDTFMTCGAGFSEGRKDGDPQPFDLQEILRQAHDGVSPAADGKNIALSWFMPPHLPHRYCGRGEWLQDVLRMLLESAVRATSRGAVQLTVRRVPESVDAGHLLFIVADTGSGMPPTERSSLALMRAWEMVGAHRGFLGVECGPLGTSVSFTLHMQVAAARSQSAPDSAETQAASALPGIILVDDSPGSRQLLTFFLEEMPYAAIEARDVDEAVKLYGRKGARLLIFDADMPIDFAEATARIREMERATGCAPALFMALSSDDSQWEGLSRAGFTHALPKPVTRKGLRDAVRQLLEASDHGEGAPVPPLVARPESPEAEYDGEILDSGLPLPEFNPPPPPPPPFVPPAALEDDEESVLLAPAPDLMPYMTHGSAQDPTLTPVPARDGDPLSLDPPRPPAEGAAERTDGDSLNLTPPSDNETPSPAPVREDESPGLTPETALSRLLPPEVPSGPADFDTPLKGGDAYLTSLIINEEDDEPLITAPLKSHAKKSESKNNEGYLTSLLLSGDDDALPSTPPPEAETVQQGRPQGRPHPMTEDRRITPAPESAASSASEWVGEPVPVRTPAKRVTIVRAKTVHLRPPQEEPQPATSGGQAPAAFDDAGHAQALEWVGEPVPVPKAAADAETVQRRPQERPQPATSGGQAPAAFDNAGRAQALEWVGEPVPVPKAAADADASALLSPASENSPAYKGAERPSLLPHSAPLLDFIIADDTPEERDDAHSNTEFRPVASDASEPSAEKAAAPRSLSVNIGEATDTSASRTLNPSLDNLLYEFDAAANGARKAFRRGDTEGVGRAAGFIVSQADRFGLRALGRMARCVEDAAKAGDKDALSNLLPELELFVERNRISMRGR